MLKGAPGGGAPAPGAPGGGIPPGMPGKGGGGRPPGIPGIDMWKGGAPGGGKGMPPGPMPGMGPSPGAIPPGWFCGSMGLAWAWPSAAYEDVMESMTDWAFSWPISRRECCE